MLDDQLQYRIVGRKQMVDDVVQFCVDPSEDGDRDFQSVPLIVHGAPGAGCSCLLANVIDLYRDRPDLKNDVVVHLSLSLSFSLSLSLSLWFLCVCVCVCVYVCVI